MELIAYILNGEAARSDCDRLNHPYVHAKFNQSCVTFGVFVDESI